MSKQVTVDTIVRESLLENQLSLHYYLRFLNFTLRCLREITFDFPINIKEVRLPLTSYKAVEVPEDFVDIVRVGVEKFDKVETMVHNPLLNGLYNLNEADEPVPYTRETDILEVDFYSVYGGSNVNSNGEYMGRNFGYVGTKTFSHRYIPERNEIQFSIDVVDDEIILWYISDGVSITTANVVHPYAKEAIIAWNHWKFLKHMSRQRISDTRDSEDYFYNQIRKLRGRLSNIGIDELFMAGRQAHHSGVKE